MQMWCKNAPLVVVSGVVGRASHGQLVASWRGIKSDSDLECKNTDTSMQQIPLTTTSAWSQTSTTNKGSFSFEVF